jgi:molybdenum cofactor biosynthesis protein MoaC
MIDISNKTKTLRIAEASARVNMRPETMQIIREGKVPKGNPLEVAKVAAVQAAKETSRIIPYCHPLPMDFVGVEYEIGEAYIEVRVTAKAIHKTGVEMEALTAASVAALTIYDMLKFADETMEIAGVKLLRKKGGKSDYKDVFATPLRAAVLVMSDTVASGRKEDVSGKIIVERLKGEGVEVVDYGVIPDEEEDIRNILMHYTDELKLDMVLTTGGTGLGPRDRTPEAMKHVIEKTIPGITEAARAYGQDRMPYSMLSRGVAGVRGNTIIVNLPGSKAGVEDSLNAVLKSVLHVFKMMQGGGH